MTEYRGELRKRVSTPTRHGRDRVRIGALQWCGPWRSQEWEAAADLVAHLNRRYGRGAAELQGNRAVVLDIIVGGQFVTDVTGRRTHDPNQTELRCR